MERAGVKLALRASLFGLALSAPATAADQPLLTASQACKSQSITTLERFVAIDSGTENTAGITAVGQAIAAEFAKLGGKVSFVPASVPGYADSLLAVFDGKGSGNILLLPHMDTVFVRGAAVERPAKIDGDRLIGPGAGDDKGGVVTAICALTALRAVHFESFKRITVLVNSNEEIGSKGSADLIKAQARLHDVVLVLEGGLDPDAVKVQRKGGGSIRLDVAGRAAHAGVEPEKGRNALLEAAHQALLLGLLADPAKQTTVNATLMQAGTVSNVIPDHASVTADVRIQEPGEFDRIERDLAKQISHVQIEGTTVTATLDRGFPPFPHLASTDKLVERAKKLYAEIDRPLAAEATGGAGDIGLVAETGTPALDGLGFVGGGAHSVDDYVVISSIAPRIYLLARMIMDLGQDPPKR